MKVGRESPEELRERVKKIIKLLREHYPHSRTALHYETPFQLLVATILAAQCTDEKVNQITPLLFKKYPTIADLARASQAEVEAIIRPTGFFRNKARNIIAAARSIMEEFGGEVPDRIEELIKLPGVARKTANIVLSSAFRRAEGIAVDTHVRRLAHRLGLSSAKDPNKIEQDLMAIVPREDWLDFNYLLVDHGRAVCQARHPLCNECFLRSLCPAAAEMAAEKAGEQK
ncbi:MAG: endonuclease III [Candidatus Aminicenantes bacterium]|nr:MAG: endonuclease III [Candidatus Aminicenantes bacterium]RLE04814.1 MAG: endonuclease III [Candidatus Aminicenantes bacterium]